MKHLGDITQINGAEIEIVDVITGGSPCQDLSIAGKRAGLAGARSGLFMEQVRIVKEMREADKRNGRAGNMVRPRFLVWENVVGAFSSNRGKDFAAVLEEIARIAEPGFSLSGLPDKWKWTKAGAIDGDGWSIAWRTHDAKDWGKTIRDSRTGNVIRLGTPQRRRRISVVADFGGDTASEIQFDSESLSGDIAESGAAGEGSAEAAEGSFNPAVGDCLTAWDCQSKRIFDTDGKSPTLQGGVGGGVNNPAIFTAIPINDKATRWQGGGESRNHDGSGNGLGIGKEGDPSPTLTAGDRHGVMAVALDMTHACDVIRECVEQVPALQARMGTGGNQVPLTYQDGTGTLSPGAHAGSYNGQDAYNDMLVVSSEISPTLRAKANDPYREDMAAYIASVDCRNFCEGGETNGTLQAKESGGQSLNLQNTIRIGMIVRRLTPMECERLQGFPDHWTDIGEWYDSQTGEGYWFDSLGKRHKTADSPRYKALGNSIALPFWDFLAKRISAQYLRPVTMGSLFDGIGGFPLVFERHNGKGTARWASEIEEFPIAVTKLRFGED